MRETIFGLLLSTATTPKLRAVAHYIQRMVCITNRSLAVKLSWLESAFSRALLGGFGDFDQ